MNPSAVEFVLVRPKRPENVAAACRALKNMGFGALALVDPPAGLESASARALAYGAWDVLDGARVAPGLRQAVATSSVVVATSRRDVEGALTARELAQRLEGLAGGGRVSIVFGPEDHGLTQADLRLCHMRVHVPTHAAQPSLNLAQAVLILAYELRLAGAGEQANDDGARSASVTAGEFEELVDDLRDVLSRVGYLNPANPAPILDEIRALLWRARPTPRETTLLRGVLRQLRWVSGRAVAAQRPD